MPTMKFASALINAAPSQIAVMDATGSIVAVNRAWKRFARENGGAKTAFLGANYLEACRSAARRDGDEIAQSVTRAFEELLHGDRQTFTIEYPCHSPSVQRWFIGRVSRFSFDGRTFLVAIHDDITARKTAELELHETKVSLEEANRRLREVLAQEHTRARTDELTGVSNRRHFFDLARQMFATARRYGTPLSLLMFDVDRFKRINDEHGHMVGDSVLRSVARIARDHTRESDVLARYGGEEFVMAFPNTAPSEALKVAEKIRAKVAAGPERPGEGGPRVTISVGVAGIPPGEETLDGLLQRADTALYAAKKAGRDCSRVAEPAGRATAVRRVRSGRRARSGFRNPA